MKNEKHELLDDGVFWITIEEFHKSMLYVVVSFYHDDWFHNYITQKDDDGEKHTFLFDIFDG